MSKHTPGPWVVNREKYAHITNTMFAGIVADICYVAGEEPLFVCTPTDWIVTADERLPNARLIAAAPDLLEALQDVLAWIDEIGAEAKRRDTERLAPARAAIAKAEGR